MGAFLLSKWYMDCVSDAGDVAIAYVARLRWRSITLHYSSILTRDAGGAAKTDTSLREARDPQLDGRVLTWAAPALGVSGKWSSLTAAACTTVFESPSGHVAWRCHQPGGLAEVTVADRTIRGRGYAEHLELTVEPWRLPIDELRWGRFVGERMSLVWIDWRGRHTKQVVLVDGVEVGAASVDERSVRTADARVRLDIEEGGALREGAIGKTALARIPGIEQFPMRILALDERKWASRGTLARGGETDRGWVIHEVVRWPAASDKKHLAGKALYGSLFAIVVPLLLALWGHASERLVNAPAMRSVPVGTTLLGTGALLVLAGWLALWRHGGGLPMNAFPPPRLVTHGVYGVVAHPIYVGFSLICLGASIASGSASGLWLVTPAVVLGVIALVLGYEGHDLDARFGPDRGSPLFGLPPATDEPASWGRRVSALLMGVVPWAAMTLVNAHLVEIPGFIAAASAPLAARTSRDLRPLVLRSLLAMPLIFPLHWLIPSVSPSFFVILALFAADMWTVRAPAVARHVTRALAWAFAAGVDFLTGRADLAGVAASTVAYVVVVHADVLWEGLRSMSERIANSWSEMKLGRMRIINHGKWGGLAAFGGITILAMFVGPGHAAGLAVCAAGTLLGAGIWAQTIEGSPVLSRPFGFYGGVLGYCVGALAGPLVGSPTWLLLGAMAVAGTFIQGVGRLRCLVQGCCHGSPTSPTIGIRYHHPRSRVCLLAHLEGVPIHPTPLYSLLWNAVTFVVVTKLWSCHVALPLLCGVYLLLNGLGRFCEEAYRGEPQTPIFARLRLYQWVAIGQVTAGAVLTTIPGGGQAPAAHPNLGGTMVAAAFGFVYWFALGVDFPSSRRRFSRLAASEPVEQERSVREELP